MKKYTTFEYRRPEEISARGATAPDGRPYIRISASGKDVWLPRDAFAGGGATARLLLKNAGMPMIGPEWKACIQTAQEVDAFPAEPLAIRRGWNNPHFALGNGRIFSPSGAAKPVVLFGPDRLKWGKSGTVKRWREITRALSGQHLATFVLMTGFAGPLLELMGFTTNIGFELTGAAGVGKSTLQKLAAAVLGPVDHPSGINFWLTANTTMNGFEQVLSEYNDAAVIIEEATLFAAADHVAARAAKWNDLVFRLSEGSIKRRFNSYETGRSRFIFLNSANEPLAQVLAGHRVPVAEAAADRLITIPISSERPYGVFDHLPKHWSDWRELVQYLSAALRNCHGVAFPRFINRLVRMRAKNEAELVSRIRNIMADFRERTGVDCNSGSEARVADSFGLVVAGGTLAVSCGAISPMLEPMEAGLVAYHLHLTTRPKYQSHLKKLRELQDDFDSLGLDPGSLHSMTDDELDQFCCLRREMRNGGIELLFTPSQLRRAFPDQRAFFADPEIRRVMVAEEGRRQTKRQLRSNRKAERVHCFRLS